MCLLSLHKGPTIGGPTSGLILLMSSHIYSLVCAVCRGQGSQEQKASGWQLQIYCRWSRMFLVTARWIMPRLQLPWSALPLGLKTYHIAQEYTRYGPVWLAWPVHLPGRLKNGVRPGTGSAAEDNTYNRSIIGISCLGSARHLGSRSSCW